MDGCCGISGSPDGESARLTSNGANTAAAPTDDPSGANKFGKTHWISPGPPPVMEPIVSANFFFNTSTPHTITN